MSNLICPFCQQELNQDSPQIIECRNDDCKKSYFMYGSKELWQELIRTRKALDVALCSLQDIAESDGDFITGSSTTLDAHEYAEMMLDKIKTALEQKDVK